jgi:hypothetical protein
LPKAPFTLGVFDYPTYPDLRVRWIGLSAGTIPIIFLAISSIELFDRGEGGAIGGLMLAGVTVAVTAFWAAAAAGCFLAIMQSTSEGLDDLGAAGEADWSDWFYSALYVINALVFSVLPGWLPMQLFGAGLLVKGLFGLATGWFLFPLVLMSMLEANSPFVPVSQPVLRSVNVAHWAWKSFYFMTALLSLGTYLAVAAAVPMGGFAMCIAGAIVVGSTMIYFRLLGRLAWVCAELMPHEEKETPADDDDERD